MSRRELYRADHDGVLLQVDFVVSTTFSANASNYWDITVRRVRGDQAFGEDVGDTFSLSTLTLTADETVTLYADAKGTELLAEDRIVAEIASTGSPVPLTDAVFWLKVQRKVR